MRVLSVSSMRFPSSPVRSKSIEASGNGRVIGFEAEPRDGVMLDVRCFAGGITGNAGAFGGIGNGPEGRFGSVGIGRDGDAGIIGRGIFQPGCVLGLSLIHI